MDQVKHSPPTTSWPGTEAARWVGAQASQVWETLVPGPEPGDIRDTPRAPYTFQLENEKRDRFTHHQCIWIMEMKG